MAYKSGTMESMGVKNSNMANLAICIPTYNRTEVLMDTFSYELDNCKQLGIDIYIYDSSTDGRTKVEIDALSDYDNLYYIPIDSSVTLDEKVVKIYQSIGRTKKHDYLWLVGDSVSFSREVLKNVTEAIQTLPTMVVINNEDVQHLGNKEYNKVNELFRELFWKSTLWGSIIIKEALYDDLDWDSYIHMFVGTDQISVGLHWYRLSQVTDFRAILFSVRKNIDLRKSKLKEFAWWKGKACGSETTYRVWAKGLIDVVNYLPYSECDKLQALKTQRIYMKQFNWLGLCRNRKDGVYNLSIYKKYKAGLKILSNYPYFVLALIAISPILIMKVIVRLSDKIISLISSNNTR